MRDGALYSPVLLLLPKSAGVKTNAHPGPGPWSTNENNPVPEDILCPHNTIDVRQNHELHRLWVDHYNATSGVVRVLGECELAWRAGRAKDQHTLAERMRHHQPSEPRLSNAMGSTLGSPAPLEVCRAGGTISSVDGAKAVRLKQGPHPWK